MSATEQIETGRNTGPRTWKLTLAYDGTDFFGWQVQPGRATIQGELRTALDRITGESPLPQGSGRTDAGVHALAQVASFSLNAAIPPENLQRALNHTLPTSIRVLDAQTVGNAFHARHSAVAKTYEYRIFRDAICSPFLARFVYPCRWHLDFDKLEQSARAFLGEHDFLSFAATEPDLSMRLCPIEPDQDRPATDRKVTLAASTVRTIFASGWERHPIEDCELWVYRVRGNGFLHHMVRNLVGTMLEIARGQIAPDQIPEIHAARSRAAAGPTAPARGLFLHSVEYPRDTWTTEQ